MAFRVPKKFSDIAIGQDIYRCIAEPETIEQCYRYKIDFEEGKYTKISKELIHRWADPDTGVGHVLELRPDTWVWTAGGEIRELTRDELGIVEACSKQTERKAELAYLRPVPSRRMLP